MPIVEARGANRPRDQAVGDEAANNEKTEGNKKHRSTLFFRWPISELSHPPALRHAGGFTQKGIDERRVREQDAIGSTGEVFVAARAAPADRDEVVDAAPPHLGEEGGPFRAAGAGGDPAGLRPRSRARRRSH